MYVSVGMWKRVFVCMCERDSVCWFIYRLEEGGNKHVKLYTSEKNDLVSTTSHSITDQRKSCQQQPSSCQMRALLFQSFVHIAVCILHFVSEKWIQWLCTLQCHRCQPLAFWWTSTVWKPTSTACRKLAADWNWTFELTQRLTRQCECKI